MGDRRRFDLFAELVSRNLSPDMRVADVAAGKGYLRSGLFQRGFRDVTSWDRRKGFAKPRSGYRYGYFKNTEAPEYDAVVGMHPDGATDEIIAYAGMRRVPAIVCPCCAIPSASTYWGNRGSYKDWVAHLVQYATRLRLDVTVTSLRMTGRNQVLILRPEKPPS